jgi:O-antigen/teichoic acid export membrane protein
LLTILFVIARPFFTLWAGPDFGRESTIPFYILLCGLLFNLSAYIPSSLLLAAGRTDIFAKLYWIELIPYIFLTGVLATFYGAVGAAAAWSLRVIADAFTFFWLARRVSGVAVGLRPYTTSIIFGAVLLVPVIVVVLIYPTPNVWLLGLMLAASVMIYAALMWYTVIDKDEKRWASAWLERMVFWRRVRAS